ncbi:hypothetical protein DL93DRAFT_2158224 [Clavulina sp. PMI_390]|nr:hypothetical protein DL93DRAFT_2158224 [Clavulina sp. PMI_390]
MSVPSSPRPSSNPFDLVSGDIVSARMVSPSLPRQVSQYYLHEFAVYYCLYQDGGPLPSYRMLGATDDEETMHLGRLPIAGLPPPRDIRCLKRYIARLEGFSAEQVEAIFLHSESVESEEDTARLSLSAGSPGYDPEHPIHGIIVDGAHRSAPVQPTLIRPLTSSDAQPQLPPSRLPTPTLLNTVIHNNVLHYVDANGFAEPKVEQGRAWIVCGASDLPGWSKAHIKSPTLAPIIFQNSNDRPPRKKSTPTELIQKTHLLLVDTRRTYDTANGGKFFRAIWDCRKILILLPINEAELEVSAAQIQP